MITNGNDNMKAKNYYFGLEQTEIEKYQKSKNIEVRDPIPNLFRYDWSFPAQNGGNGIFNLHPYPAKFIPQIPNTLIKSLGVPKETVVFDPFCGSGTTMIVSQMFGLPSIGIDLNPIGCLISKVATRPCPLELEPSAEICIKRAREMEGLHSIPDIPNLDHWFQKPIQEAIVSLLFVIEGIKDDSLRETMHLALSSIIVRISNQDSDTRYAAVRKQVSSDDVYRLFLLACKKYKKILPKRTVPGANAFILNSDVLSVSPKDIPSEVGLVICSPPYPAAYEYWLYHKYRMWWLGYDPISVKKSEIGSRAHYFKKNHHRPEDFEFQMAQVFKLLSKVCCQDAYICFVLGNSKIHGKIIDNSTLLIAAARQYDFSLKALIPRNIAMNRKSFNLSNSRIKTENIVVFQK
jgi:site-specific DNA-methyltransferase (cytosine-N4-specific)